MKISDKSLAFWHLCFPKNCFKFSSLQLLVQMLRNLFNQLTEITFFHVLDFWDLALKTEVALENKNVFWKWTWSVLISDINSQCHSCAPPLVMIYSFFWNNNTLQIKVQRHISKTLQCAEFKNADAESTHLNVW